MSDRITKTSGLSRGYLIAFAATAIWSSTAIFIRYLSVHFQLAPLALAFWRDLFAALALGTITFIWRPRALKPGLNTLKFLCLYGLVLTLFNSTWTVSVFYNGAAVSTVLAYSSGAFTAVLGWRLFRERLDRFKVIAVLLSLGGCVLVAGAFQISSWQLNPIGVITGLVSGLMMAFYSLMGRWASFRKVDPFSSLTFTFAIAAGFLLIANIVPISTSRMTGDLLALGSSLSGWAVLIILAIGPTIGGYGLYTLSLGYLPASVANLIATLEPAFTAVLAFIFLGETLTIIQLAGSALILSGVVFLRFSDRTSA
jgi:drug/metabolite transporter (DMT)-like permease